MNHLNISIVFIQSIINLKMKGTEEEVFSLKQGQSFSIQQSWRYVIVRIQNIEDKLLAQIQLRQKQYNSLLHHMLLIKRQHKHHYIDEKRLNNTITNEYGKEIDRHVRQTNASKKGQLSKNGGGRVVRVNQSEGRVKKGCLGGRKMKTSESAVILKSNIQQMDFVRTQLQQIKKVTMYFAEKIISLNTKITGIEKSNIFSSSQLNVPTQQTINSMLFDKPKIANKQSVGVAKQEGKWSDIMLNMQERLGDNGGIRQLKSKLREHECAIVDIIEMTRGLAKKMLKENLIGKNSCGKESQ